MKKTFLFVLCCCLITAIYAQDTESKQYTVSGGVLGAVNLSKFRISGDNPTNIDYESKAGWAAGGWVNFPVGTGFSIEPQLMYSSYRYFTTSTTPLLLNDGKIGYISLPVLLKFHLSDKFALTAGPQVDFVSSVKDNDNIAPVVTESDFNKTSFSLFGGVELLPRGRVSIFGRYIHGLSNMDDRANHATNMEFKNQNFQIGLKLRLFGGTTAPLQATTVVLDSDGDGINDDVDKCPSQFGLAKYNGCPIPDSDADGINDEQDKCPNQAGVAKYEGCPVPDSDGDGINDELDKCPNQAGPADRNGCPASDRDNDGIIDENDKCPDIAGISANNGCPEVPANVSKSLAAAGQNISFGTGAKNTTITTRSYAALDQIVALMNENPGLRIRVEGHTDNVGNADANEDLSSAQAKAVMDYLISKGISEDRISKEGFGGTQPIADNSTAAGRAKNRRIEIRVSY